MIESDPPKEQIHFEKPREASIITAKLQIMRCANKARQFTQLCISNQNPSPSILFHMSHRPESQSDWQLKCRNPFFWKIDQFSIWCGFCFGFCRCQIDVANSLKVNNADCDFFPSLLGSRSLPIRTRSLNETNEPYKWRNREKGKKVSLLIDRQRNQEAACLSASLYSCSHCGAIGKNAARTSGKIVVCKSRRL